MIFLAQSSEQPLDNLQRKQAEEKFNAAVDAIISDHRPMSAEAMASLFDEDGYLGSAMRSMLVAEDDDYKLAA